MGQVTLNLNGKVYRLRCGDGEEERIQTLADEIRARIEATGASPDHAGDDRLLLMACLHIADDLWEARGKIASLEAQIAAHGREQPTASLEPPSAGDPPSTSDTRTIDPPGLDALSEARSTETETIDPPADAGPAPPLSGTEAQPVSPEAAGMVNRRPPGSRGTLEERLAEARAASRSRDG